MTEQYSNIICESNSFKLKGIEILRIEDLYKRKESLEKPHLLDFYLFIFYTEGESQHFIDFSWNKVEKGTLVYLTEGQLNACLLYTSPSPRD